MQTTPNTKNKTIFEHSKFPMLIFSRTGKVLDVNIAWEETFHLNKAEICTGNVLQDSSLVENFILSYLLRAWSGESVTVPLFWSNQAESLLRAWISPVKDACGVLQEIAVVYERMRPGDS